MHWLAVSKLLPLQVHGECPEYTCPAFVLTTENGSATIRHSIIESYPSVVITIMAVTCTASFANHYTSITIAPSSTKRIAVRSSLGFSSGHRNGARFRAVAKDIANDSFIISKAVRAAAHAIAQSKMQTIFLVEIESFCSLRAHDKLCAG